MMGALEPLGLMMLLLLPVMVEEEEELIEVEFVDEDEDDEDDDDDEDEVDDDAATTGMTMVVPSPITCVMLPAASVVEEMIVDADIVSIAADVACDCYLMFRRRWCLVRVVSR